MLTNQMEKSSIHINPKNKGKFTATKKATGKSTEELTHSKNPLTRKRAIFAQNAKKWHNTNENKIMRKQVIRLTESDLHRIIENTVKRIIKEEDEEEYNPWMNGDASYIDGSYDIPYGYHVEIDTSLGTVAIDDPQNEDGGYFLQGDEADDLISDICRYWIDNDCSQEEAVNAVISAEF